jgi:aspartate/methionine/tyrosine aminotransferase
MQEIITICENNNSILFSDEVYRFSEYNGEMIPVADKYKNGLSLGVLSKPLGLPGLRIGWIASQNQEILARLQAYKDYTTICNSAPSEFLAEIALRNKEIILQRNRKIIDHNLNLLDDFFAKYHELFEWVRPTAGSIGFVKIKFSDNVAAFCEAVIMKKGILLLPSTVFDYGNKHFRIGFGRKNMPIALRILEEYVTEVLNK